VLSRGAGLAYDLMIAVGRAADGMITSSRQRLLAHLSGDFEGAALEMERHLRVLGLSMRCVYQVKETEDAG